MKRKEAFFNIDLEGLERLESLLEQLPIKLQRKALRSSLQHGTEIVKEEARRNCPKRKPAHGWMAFVEDLDQPSLHDNIVSKVTVSKTRAWGRVGIDYKKVRHGHLVEFGTEPHRQKKLGIQHPGARKRPFMRPAVDNKGEEAANVMANELYDAVIEGLK